MYVRYNGSSRTPTTPKGHARRNRAERQVLSGAPARAKYKVTATNLTATINAAASMDAQHITTLVTTLVSAMKSELLSQIKQEILAFHQHSTQQSTTSPSLSAAPSGSQVSNGQQAVFSPPGSNQPPQGTPASTSIRQVDPVLQLQQLSYSTSMTKPLKLNNMHAAGGVTTVAGLNQRMCVAAARAMHLCIVVRIVVVTH